MAHCLVCMCVCVCVCYGSYIPNAFSMECIYAADDNDDDDVCVFVLSCYTYMDINKQLKRNA